MLLSRSEDRRERHQASSNGQDGVNSTSTKSVSSGDSDRIAALGRSQALIEFKPDGTIVTANENFLGAVGYTLEEIVGKHHSIFVSVDEQNSTSYRQFWEQIARGEFKAGEFMRVNKSGEEIWIQASYNPLVNDRGEVYGAIKIASDITAEKTKSLVNQGQIDALNRAQAVIRFKLDGTIIDANENFTGAVGYSLEEIRGRHHSIFVPEELKGPKYEEFWRKLRSGEFVGGEFRRVGKDGDDIWIQATYNPIFDQKGRPFEVVKFATDITAMIKERERRVAGTRSIDSELDDVLNAVNNAVEQADSVAAASTETAAQVESVATNTTQLSASVQEISQQVTDANEVSRQAVNRAEDAGGIISSLSEAAQEIGAVVNLISDIADQTNLLALNATIEAARAGDVGKGFAVVASEVKALANQSAKATDQIREKIKGIQSSTEGAVTSISDISEVIQRVNDISMSIAGAVEEQTVVTENISLAMNEATTGVNQISASVASIAQVNQTINEATSRVKEVSASLS